MPTEPALHDLRQQLERFDDVRLDKLCLDHFPEVYRRFGRGLQRDEKVNLLLDHCRRMDGLARLAHLLAAPDPVLDPEFPASEAARLADPCESIPRPELIRMMGLAGARLRNYPNQVAGVTIERPEAAEIMEWVVNAPSEQRLGVLIDQPGGGKTVVMRMVLEQLEAADIPILAIKADSLGNVQTPRALSEFLRLPCSVEDCVAVVAQSGLCVVLLDQLDTLSLSLSADQAFLDLMLDTLARLREIPNVCIVASCRVFELKHDPRLSTVDPDRTFQLQALSDTQILPVLQALEVDPEALSREHRKLLTVPQHLRVYGDLIANASLEQRSESYRSLQDLYDALWRHWILSRPPQIPTPEARVQAINKLVDAMERRKRLGAPVAVLDGDQDAASYLESNHIIYQENGYWRFSHQTLFDHCYARRFVASDESLSEYILESEQGLFERSQMIQVLVYLRGADRESFLREVGQLLTAQNLRAHLHLLLYEWLASLSNPTAEEASAVSVLFDSVASRNRFLQAAQGNIRWFDLLPPTLLPDTLRSEDEVSVGTVVSYLASLVDRRTTAVLECLAPYLHQSEAWDARIGFILSQIEHWTDERALDMLLDLCRRGQGGWRLRYTLRNLLESRPDWASRAIRGHLDYVLDSQLAGDESSGTDRYYGTRDVFEEHEVTEVVRSLALTSPLSVIEHILPWFVRATQVLAAPSSSPEHYPSDSVFAYRWYDEHTLGGVQIAGAVVTSMRHLAQTHSSRFRELAQELATVESLAVHRLLAQVYLDNPERYASGIYTYITGDRRRLIVGEHNEESVRLFQIAFQYATPEQRRILEAMILGWWPSWERKWPDRVGFTHFEFLYGVPSDLLSDEAKDRVGCLRRKFDNYEPFHPVRITEVRKVGPPISEQSQHRMSDQDWLTAMRHHDGQNMRGGDKWEPLRGGIDQLAQSLAERTRENPERFYRLASAFTDDIHPSYIVAVLNGLTGSAALPNGVFDLIIRFSHSLAGEHRIGACRAVREHSKTSAVPDEVLDLITEWAIHDPDPVDQAWEPLTDADERHPSSGSLGRGINSVRGVAIESVCAGVFSHEPPHVERAFTLLEHAAQDDSDAVRACVIDQLAWMLRFDKDRAVDIFVHAVDGRPRLRQEDITHRFLSWVYPSHFAEIEPILVSLLHDPDPATREAGAMIVCLSGFSHPETAGPLVAEVMTGDDALRTGAARIYARNLGNSRVHKACLEGLLALLDHPAESVRQKIGESFRHLGPEHFDSVRPFIAEFIDSPSLISNPEHLIRYLGPLCRRAGDLALFIVNRILDVAGDKVVDMRTREAILEADLARLPLNVYRYSDTPAIRDTALSAFERMLLLNSRTAYSVLRDWERK